MTDQAGTLAAAKKGSEVAFADLIAPLRPELVIHGYRMLGSVTEAEDCVQESLLRAWRALSSYDERGNFRAWLYRIVTNRCLTALERHGRHRELPSGSPTDRLDEVRWLEPLPGSALAHAVPQTPEAHILARESVQLAFLTVLQRLPPRQRAVLVIRDVLGFTAAECAEQLDMTVAAVNSALQRARLARGSLQPTTPVGVEPEPDAVQRYAAAWEDGDIDAIVAMLAEDARYSMPPLRESFVGPLAIRDFLRSGPLHDPGRRWRFLPSTANGQPAFGTYHWDPGTQRYRPAGLDVLTFTADGKIAEVVSFLEVNFADFDLPPDQR